MSYEERMKRAEEVYQRRKNGGYVGKDIDKPLDVNIKEFEDK